jgi:hypothetical protein
MACQCACVGGPANLHGMWGGWALRVIDVGRRVGWHTVLIQDDQNPFSLRESIARIHERPEFPGTGRGVASVSARLNEPFTAACATGRESRLRVRPRCARRWPRKGVDRVR